MAASSKLKIAAAAALYLLLKKRQRRRLRWKNRRHWTKPWILRRYKQSIYVNLIKELSTEDARDFTKYMRLSPDNFKEILDMVTPYIQRQNTTMREAISPEQRLAITLRFLATGETFNSLSFQYSTGKSTISAIVKETCRVIYSTLKEKYMKMPCSEQEWEEVANNFDEKWNYPFCIGALDGKHIKIQSPHCSGSMYFNYKGYFSVVLLALVDANYQFLYVNVGAAGRSGDAGVFDNSSLKIAMQQGKLNLPEPGTLPGTKELISYHIVGDDAFPLSRNLMKPYPHRNLDRDSQIYNYRFSRARRVVENAFGILASRFRVFLTSIVLEPEHVQSVILASCCLHNYLVQKNSSQYLSNMVEEARLADNRKAFTELQPTQHRNSPVDAKTQRDLLKKYFVSERGMVPWQDKMLG